MSARIWAVIIILASCIGVSLGLLYNNHIIQLNTNIKTNFENTHNGTINNTWRNNDRNIRYIIWEDKQGNSYLTLETLNEEGFISLPKINNEYTIKLDTLTGGKQ